MIKVEIQNTLQAFIKAVLDYVALCNDEARLNSKEEVVLAGANLTNTGQLFFEQFKELPIRAQRVMDNTILDMCKEFQDNGLSSAEITLEGIFSNIKSNLDIEPEEPPLLPLIVGWLLIILAIAIAVASIIFLPQLFPLPIAAIIGDIGPSMIFFLSTLVEGLLVGLSTVSSFISLFFGVELLYTSFEKRNSFEEKKSQVAEDREIDWTSIFNQCSAREMPLITEVKDSSEINNPLDIPCEERNQRGQTFFANEESATTVSPTCLTF